MELCKCFIIIFKDTGEADLLHNPNLQKCLVKSSSHSLTFVFHLLCSSSTLVFMVPIKVQLCFYTATNWRWHLYYWCFKGVVFSVCMRGSLVIDFTILSDKVYMVVSHSLLVHFGQWSSFLWPLLFRSLLSYPPAWRLERSVDLHSKDQ